MEIWLRKNGSTEYILGKKHISFPKKLQLNIEINGTQLSLRNAFNGINYWEECVDILWGHHNGYSQCLSADSEFHIHCAAALGYDEMQYPICTIYSIVCIINIIHNQGGVCGIWGCGGNFVKHTW